MALPAPPSLAFTIWGPIARDDLPGLCERVCTLFSGCGPGTAVCDVRGVRADAVTVDALARLQLAARRSGLTVVLRQASPDLVALVCLMGLSDVLPECPGGSARAGEEKQH